MAELTQLRDENGSSLLHTAVSIERRLFTPFFPSVEFAKLLVEVGKMDVDIRDKLSRTPLHIISEDTKAGRINLSNRRNVRKVIKLLIDNGAHVDSVDSSGIEASQGVFQRFPDLSRFPSLQCIAAKTIIRHQLPYHILPKLVVKDVELHIPAMVQIGTSKDGAMGQTDTGTNGATGQTDTSTDGATGQTHASNDRANSNEDFTIYCSDDDFYNSYLQQTEEEIQTVFLETRLGESVIDLSE